MQKLMTVVTLTAVALGATLAGSQLKTPTDWKWRSDTPATITETGDSVAPDEWFFVGMPPGWHITTGPGVLLYHPSHPGRGNFSLRSEIFLFPGDNQEEYGFFLGGRGLERESTNPAYTAFVVRRDGRAGVFTRNGPTATPVIGWTANSAVLAHPGGSDAVKNVLHLDVGATEIVFSANDKEITRVERSTVTTEGALGFRVGRSVNLHITSLDVTYKLAPMPVKK